MRRRVNATITVLVVLLGSTPAAVAAQERPTIGGLEVRDRFVQTVQLAMRAGGVRDLQIEVHHWSLHGGQRIDRLPGTGFRVVQLVAGTVATVINGQRTARREGEFWSVPAGTTMLLETGDDVAVLQVTTVR